jgi:hypothetical protein
MAGVLGIDLRKCVKKNIVERYTFIPAVRSCATILF